MQEYKAPRPSPVRAGARDADAIPSHTGKAGAAVTGKTMPVGPAKDITETPSLVGWPVVPLKEQPKPKPPKEAPAPSGIAQTLAELKLRREAIDLRLRELEGLMAQRKQLDEAIAALEVLCPS